MSLTHRRSLVAAALALTVLAAAPAASASADEHSVPGTAGAATLSGTPEPARSAFYEPPAVIDGRPGRSSRTPPAPRGWATPARRPASCSR